MNQIDMQASPLRRLIKNIAPYCALLAALMIVPAAVYAGQVAGLIIFVNGEIADADDVNANFAALATAVNDNDTRISTMENLLGTSCPPGQFVSAITLVGSLTCATP